MRMVKVLPAPSSDATTQPAAMAVEDVLDDGEAKAGAAARAAFLHVDAVEPLGQPRNMFFGDARPDNRAP